MCEIFYEIDGINGYLVKASFKYIESQRIYKLLELTGISKDEEFYDFIKEFDNKKVVENVKQVAFNLVNCMTGGGDVNIYLIVDFFNQIHFKKVEKVNSKKVDPSSRFKIVELTQINYAELMLDVVNQTDQENWDYFSEDDGQLANEFLDYGKFSRVITKNEYGKEIAVGYVQVRLLKEQAPQLLYKDFYHLAGLGGINLWEKSKNSSRDLPIYIDVIAIKKQYQNQLDLLKLVPQALSEIVEDIDLTIPDIAFGKVFAVGVTKQGRKMCNLLKMDKCSEVERVESGITHIRTLYCSERSTFKNNLKSITKK
ncbi:hypothetical protein [Lactococcus protaetiae]|uniref:Uncharacterized protein n=1 Tax=Lactococcus protaetiae TaxID=2592653 RepID=A0A514Z845_9LACT|nr:hypothetical protein [Lactococcus protaetiae]QDK70766.1 hypothetical protein FLP15_05845 [Lactococcus protaetiae]